MKPMLILGSPLLINSFVIDVSEDEKRTRSSVRWLTSSSFKMPQPTERGALASPGLESTDFNTAIGVDDGDEDEPMAESDEPTQQPGSVPPKIATTSLKFLSTDKTVSLT